ncbi:hypothetical protein Y032_0094g2761 [Ancylostoma ceylanicum]|uniref:Ubiquitin-like domain-containing protein n=1 Tax=Ancylostoma ceylanicum TaxID=53326 RepID=A0A016TKC2_9BILA|nr:hypothetical protein Y032_0094g2761 [Ancylostoma ceylanicum]
MQERGKSIKRVGDLYGRHYLTTKDNDNTKEDILTHLNAFGTDNYRDTPCSLRCAQPQPTLAMQLRVIVYNKTRKLCGHEFFIEVSDNSSIYRVKRIIEEKTTVPHQIQWIVFGGIDRQLNQF